MNKYTGFAGQTVTEVEYKLYNITYNFYNDGMYEVQYCGDEVVFKTEDEAKQFIDEVTANEEAEWTQLKLFDEVTA